VSDAIERSNILTPAPKPHYVHYLCKQSNISFAQKLDSHLIGDQTPLAIREMKLFSQGIFRVAPVRLLQDQLLYRAIL
jgi:hypothetical protein